MLALIGKDKTFVGFYIIENGAKLYTNYDFFIEEKPIQPDEIKENERIEKVNGIDLLEYLKNQDSII